MGVSGEETSAEMMRWALVESEMEMEDVKWENPWLALRQVISLL